jgi:hypothetical protein
MATAVKAPSQHLDFCFVKSLALVNNPTEVLNCLRIACSVNKDDGALHQGLDEPCLKRTMPFRDPFRVETNHSVALGFGLFRLGFSVELVCVLDSARSVLG